MSFFFNLVYGVSVKKKKFFFMEFLFYFIYIYEFCKSADDFYVNNLLSR